MAKALFGHVGSADPRMSMELRRLQQRIHDLESEIVRLRAENDSLATSVAQRMDDADLMRLDVSKQPVLA